MFVLGYYYDNEANLYYLQSRYYDPQTHRFINMDSIEYLDPENINGLNLFAYCGNNPVVRVDYNGNAWWDWLLGAVIGGIHALATGGDFWSGVGNGALLGLGLGAFAGAVIGVIAGGISGANGWYNARALEFTNVGTNNEVVIGKHINNSPYSYDAMAKQRGSTYFSASQSRWNEVLRMKGVGEKGMWKINKVFLKQQMALGKEFVITNDYIFGYLFKEVSYITSKGVALFLI